MRKALLHLKQADPILCAIVERVGPYRIRYAEPDFETLARSIVFQQLSGQSARAIFGRVKQLVADNGRMTPHGVLARTDAELRAAGLSRHKVGYLRDLAQKTRAGHIDFARLPALPDDDVIRQLTMVKGVGVWTAQMFLLFALRRLNVLAAGDLGIRSAIRRAYRLRTLPKPSRIEQLARKWHPYCSVACWYLWRSSDDVLLS
ncbi:MAG: DNA-3-methyladenine glycosylase [candidate division NC10 bacterium]|nr:DNA-3-methyladenine glycosylase [candidate division NC10 bacterium]